MSDDVEQIVARLSKSDRARAKQWAREMPKDARLCVLNWGDRKTPIPDSCWFGRYSGIKRHAPGSACMFVLSPLGLAVRTALLSKEGESADA